MEKPEKYSNKSSRSSHHSRLYGTFLETAVKHKRSLKTPDQRQRRQDTVPSRAAGMKLLMGYMGQMASSCYKLKSELTTSPLLKAAPMSTYVIFCYHKGWPLHHHGPKRYQQVPKSISALLLASAPSPWDHHSGSCLAPGLDTHIGLFDRDAKPTVLLEGCGASFLSRRKIHISYTCVERLSAKATSGITKPCATQALCEPAPSFQP